MVAEKDSTLFLMGYGQHGSWKVGQCVAREENGCSGVGKAVFMHAAGIQA
jgi:hypothetical protein